VCHVPRTIETDLVTALTMLSGYRRARWRAVILYGLAGIGKTAIAQAVVDNARIQRTFRDGCVWLDGRRDLEEEVTHLCLALGLERAPGERWVACWRRWAGAEERRLLLIVDDVGSAEQLPPLIAGLGPQVVTLITTRPGWAVRAEVERWLPADQVWAQPVGGLTPAEGRALAAAVVGRPLTDAEWALAHAVGELTGWHAEALRLAALEGREVGWAGVLGELPAGRLPWAAVHDLLRGQWAQLARAQQAELAALVAGTAAGVWLTAGDAAPLWGVEDAIAHRRLWALRWQGLVEEDPNPTRWRVAPVVRLALGGDG